jgi:pyridoxal phosphate enzyme (YggS family)
MYSEIIKKLTESKTTLVAVSKTKPIDQIKAIYDQGQRIFGENRVQELVEKKEQLPDDIQWHLIGSLQTNKVKHIAPFVSLIHSVDSLRLAQKINDEAAKNDRVIDVLLQVKIAAEYAKQGFNKRILYQHLEKQEIQDLKNVRVVGLMGMASFTDNQSQVGGEFKNLRKIFKKLKNNHFEEEHFQHLSMGMSGDYELAIENGSNMVRIGSLIFGAR